MRYLFLSYAAADGDNVAGITIGLEQAGFIVWNDGGAADEDDQLAQQTVFSIERSDGFILVLSTRAIDSTKVEKQVALAKKANRPITVAMLELVTIPPELKPYLSGSTSVDLSTDSEDGLGQLIRSLTGDVEPGDEADRLKQADGDFVDVPRLPGEALTWSEDGYYWFKDWRTLVRLRVLATNQRLVFVWDTRDMWKWKSREEEELTRNFPISIPYTDIKSIGDIQRPKFLFIVLNSGSFVELTTNKGVVHKFSLHKQFREHIEQINSLIGQSV